MPRGKLLLGRSMREQTLPRAKVWCETDEWIPDTLLNQLMKAAAHYLAEAGEVKASLREDLRWLLRSFDRVRPVPLPDTKLGTVRVYRHTARYGLVFHLSHLVRHLALPTQETGTVLLPDGWRDERNMARLFEQFVRNFYALHLRGTAIVRASALQWQLTPEDDVSAQHLPKMQTGVVVSYNDQKRVVLLECKFYPQALGAEHHDTSKVRSAHLYQLFAYQQHLKQRFPGREIRSVLLYPVGGESVLLRYQLAGEPVRVSTLNLNQPWPAIPAAMLALLESV